MYCERQCALIHVDGVWVDNGHTTAGSLLHERVDSGEVGEREGVRVARRMSLCSRKLGLFGFADVVEFHRRGFVAGKIANSRVVLRRAARTRREGAEEIGRAADRLSELEDRALKEAGMDALRGVEGEAAARYFEVFDAMLGGEGIRFEKRTRRPPENEINALLSFGYSLLSVDCMAALQGAGLDPAVGYLHGERPGRPALALDLMEEFRAMVVDRMVLAMVRLKQLCARDFERFPTGEVRLLSDARKAFLAEYQKRKLEPMTHPTTGQEATWGQMPHLQARLLARVIRGEGEYVPFLAR